MRRLLAPFLAAALLWASPVLAAIGTPTSMGVANNSAVATAVDLPTTVVATAGIPIIGVVETGSTSTGLAITDSVGNSYAVSVRFAGSGSPGLWMFHADNPATTLPAPCTVTATTTSTTFSTSGAVTCSQGVTFTTGQTISGGSFTGKFTAPCTLSAGIVVNCAISGGAATGPATATVSSTISATWATASRSGIGAITVTGLSATPLDLTGAGTSAATGTSISSGAGLQVPVSGVLTQADEILIARTDTNGSTTGFTQSGSWNPLTKIITAAGGAEINWSYQIVAVNTGALYNPTWTTSRAYGANYYTFMGAGGAATACNVTTTGAGAC